MLDKTWAADIDPTKQPRFQPAVGFTYWPVLGSFNYWNIIKLPNENTTSEEFDEMIQVMLDIISVNMAYLVQKDKYGAINTAYPTTLVYYVVKYVS